MIYLMPSKVGFLISCWVVAVKWVADIVKIDDLTYSNHLCAKYLRALEATGSKLGSNKLSHTSLGKSFGGQFSGNNPVKVSKTMDFLNKIAPAIATIQLDMENQTSLGARYNTYLAPSQVSCIILNVAWCCRQGGNTHVYSAGSSGSDRSTGGLRYI